MLHQFVLDYLEFILAVIVLAQGIILAKNNSFQIWAMGHLNALYAIAKAQATVAIENVDEIKDLKDKLNKNS